MIIIIFVLYLALRDQLWSLETPVFLKQPISSFSIGATHTTHAAPDDQANVPKPITEEETPISRLILKLNNAGPPALTEHAACVGRTLVIEEVTIDTERRDLTPVSDEKIEAARKAHENVVEMIRNSSHLVPSTPKTRGIVTVAGGRYTGALLVTLRMLRRTNSTLPVEVFMPTPQDYNKHTCEVVLPTLNARCVMIPQYEGLTIANYQYKIFAVILSSFEDVLFLDADNFPIVDPVEWMDARVFKDTGYVLVRAFLLGGAFHQKITNKYTVARFLVGNHVPKLLQSPQPSYSSPPFPRYHRVRSSHHLQAHTQRRSTPSPLLQYFRTFFLLPLVNPMRCRRRRQGNMVICRHCTREELFPSQTERRGYRTSFRRWIQGCQYVTA